MKKLLFIITLFLGLGSQTFAQRFCYVDSKYILENMSEYKTAMEEIDALSKRWQETIEAKYAEIDAMYKAFEAEKILLTPPDQQKRLEEIKLKEQEAKDYQKSKFGVDGALFQKRQELIQPLQDRIFQAIQELAKERSYAVIFDKATNSNILYADPKYDKSDVIMKKLGISADEE